MWHMDIRPTWVHVTGMIGSCLLTAFVHLALYQQCLYWCWGTAKVSAMRPLVKCINIYVWTGRRRLSTDSCGRGRKIYRCGHQNVCVRRPRPHILCSVLGFPVTSETFIYRIRSGYSTVSSHSPLVSLACMCMRYDKLSGPEWKVGLNGV